MIGLKLAFGIALLLGALFSPIAAEAEQAAKIARIGYLGSIGRPPIPASERPSSKDCVTSVTSRAVTS